MATTPGKRALAKRRWIIGSVALVLTSLIATIIITLERKVNGVPGWGEAVLCGLCPGALSVLIYNYRGWKSFSECMHVSVMPVAALGMVLGIFTLLCLLLALVLRGVSFMLLTLLVPLVYFGGAFYLPLVMVALTMLSCAGGAFIYSALWIMRLATVGQRPQWR